MQVTNPPTDTIIEILRLAYRRGLALRQQQVEDTRQSAEQKESARPENFAEDTGQAEVKLPTPERVNHE